MGILSLSLVGIQSTTIQLRSRVLPGCDLHQTSARKRRSGRGTVRGGAVSRPLPPPPKRGSVCNQRSPVYSSRRALLRPPTAASNRRKVRASSRGTPSDAPDTDRHDHRRKRQDPCSPAREFPAPAPPSSRPPHAPEPPAPAPYETFPPI